MDYLIAIGGTAQAVGELVTNCQRIIEGYAFMINLVGLNGSDRLKPSSVFSVIEY